MSAKRVMLRNNLDEDYDQVVKGERVFIEAKKEIGPIARRRAIEIKGHYAQWHDVKRQKYVKIPCNLEIIPIENNDEEDKDTVAESNIIASLMERLEKLEKGNTTKLYVCPFCEMEFASSKGVKTHIGKAHNNDTGDSKE